MSGPIVCVVGNPNCGKTTLFNALTGGRADVGNWPGVTVEKKVGSYVSGDQTITLVDLPGVYSLSPSSGDSEDERVARDYIASKEAMLVLNIVDASNLERNLYLTAQLLEMRIPVVVAINMMDVAASRKLDIDLNALSQDLGCPVVPLVANRKKGVDLLRATISESLKTPLLPTVMVAYPQGTDKALSGIEALLASYGEEADRRWRAVQLLEGDGALQETLPQEIKDGISAIRDAAQAELGEELDILFADARYGFAAKVARLAVIRKGEVSRTLTDRIDRIVLHRMLGIPLFLAVMYVMFVFTINVGGVFIDFFDQTMEALLVEGFGHLLANIGSPGWLTVLLANGVGGGIKTVSTFIPVIGCLYLFLSVLEDSGYMSRAAFVMDRFMRAIGLPGKAFVPLIVGFGCTVPAVMATRTMDSRRDRIITVMMAPFMSCGARLPIYVLFAAALFPTDGQNLVFVLYLVGIAVAIGTGLVLRRTILQGNAAPFVMEMPPYHLPTFKGVVIRTWDRLKMFILRAGRLIIVIVVALSFLNSLGTDGSFGNEDTDSSVLAAIGKGLTPVFAPMGLSQDNWPATVGIFTGIFAKEAVVGTLNALYGTIAAGQSLAETGEEDAGFDLWQGLKDAVATIPENFVALTERFGDPIGLNVGDLSNADAVAERQEVAVGTLAVIGQLFDGRIGALAYLVLVLLYMPCVAAISAIWREVGTKWTLFAAFWTTGLGYGASVLTYQIGRFSRDPLASGLYVVSVFLVLVGMAFFLWMVGRNASGTAAPSLLEKV